MTRPVLCQEACLLPGSLLLLRKSGLVVPSHDDPWKRRKIRAVEPLLFTDPLDLNPSLGIAFSDPIGGHLNEVILRFIAWHQSQIFAVCCWAWWYLPSGSLVAQPALWVAEWPKYWADWVLSLLSSPPFPR